ncbi:puromycin-sensitive aminopeptidase, partial [Paragonimus westermani]
RTPVNMASEVFQRLPQLCRPLRYAIELRPCLKTFTFIGKQSVSVDMTESASEIVLNAKNLSVNSAKFNGVSVEVVPKPEMEQAGPAVLDLDFKGHISDKMVGFYRSAYSIENEVQKVMLATHFEPANARQAFPCWDEPDFKSVFSITLVVPKNMSAISNMPVVSKIEQDGNLVAYMFENTPKMSSYLVAFAVGEFEYVEFLLYRCGYFAVDECYVPDIRRPNRSSECSPIASILLYRVTVMVKDTHTVFIRFCSFWLSWYTNLHILTET